ncbi:phytoene/squalene synthase family protein [Roseomonas xinghualingensis]|uniref:phytoene/squalene synthase family protein n=1 Tax=Roseomonas xinghualingensis TaxID=2986475 RepID=UPI0021F1957C|nr:squalene/phytoene synthase family protein [Roseomonas sp. SXEYE001]MCV4209856.1 squalene/phytoene synthase family protein [Roseomonas sp. SXEYE001]
MEAKSALSPVAELARRHDPDRFLCALFAPSEARETIFTLIAFNNELARAREVAREPMMALIRLQWWREVVEEAVAGAPARRHEVAEPLSAAIKDGRLQPEALLRMIEGREEDEPPADRQAFEQSLAATSGALAVEMGRVLGAPDALAEPLARAGMAYGLAGTLRSLPVLLANGREPLPHDILPQGAAPSGQAVVLREMATSGLAELRSTRAALRSLPRQAIAAALPLVLARRDFVREASAGWQWDAEPRSRGAGDRLAVAWAGLRGRI